MRRKLAATAAVLLAGLLVAVFWPEPAPGPTGGWMAAAGLAPHVETVDGVRMRYVRRGEGPPVVLIHGLASSIYTWKDVLPGLAAHHDVVALDLPGFGGSDIPQPLQRRAYFGQVLGLLDRLGIARASFVGNSMGGAVALAIAARAPERVDRLVAIDAAAYAFDPSQRPPLLRFVGPFGGLLDALPVQRRLTGVGLSQVFADGSKVSDERLDEYVVPLSRPGAMAAIRTLVTDPDPMGFPELLGSVKAPTLVIWGRQDRWLPLPQGERLAREVAGARLEVLDPCGHVPQEERPADVLRLIEEFLRS
jgi:pimeloyl-ACP methyl ester carboxylesterase